MDQLSLFDIREEKLFTMSPGDYLLNFIIRKNGLMYWRQELKRKWPTGHRYEEFNQPNDTEICQKCIKKFVINELDKSGNCCNGHYGRYEK